MKQGMACILAFLVGCSGRTALSGRDTVTGGKAGSAGAAVSGGVPATGGTSGVPATGGMPATGGTVTTGGTGGVGGGAIVAAGGSSCVDVSPCGGDVVGTWTVSSSCLKVSGGLGPDELGLDCAPVPVVGSLQVRGTWIARSNGTYVDQTTTTGNEEVSLPASCLVISGTVITCDAFARVLPVVFGFDTATCPSAAGAGCNCSFTVTQDGGAGLVSSGDPQTSGSYKTSGNRIETDSGLRYSYCVSGNRMTWTPEGGNLTVTGTIVFQKIAAGAAP